MQWEPQPGMGRPPALPSLVYVRVHHFRGRQVFTDTSADVNGETIDLRNVVPMVPIEAQDEMGPAANSSGGVPARCYRSQMAMTLAFVVTDHKSQGDTLDRIVLDIGERDINDRQTFTALRRCRDINNMLLEDFGRERLQAIGNSASFPCLLYTSDAADE